MCSRDHLVQLIHVQFSLALHFFRLRPARVVHFDSCDCGLNICEFLVLERIVLSDLHLSCYSLIPCLLRMLSWRQNSLQPFMLSRYLIWINSLAHFHHSLYLSHLLFLHIVDVLVVDFFDAIECFRHTHRGSI